MEESLSPQIFTLEEKKKFKQIIEINLKHPNIIGILPYFIMKSSVLYNEKNVNLWNKEATNTIQVLHQRKGS